jgi:leucine dehydrogenase
VLIQGLGGVGAPLGRLLAEAGARLLLSDAVPARVASLAAELKGEVIAPEAAYDVACDIFAPCAIGGVINARSIPRLGCRVVGGSANNQLETAEDATRLHERGILYAPDFVINAGGAIGHGALEVLGWEPERVAERVKQIGPTLLEMLAQAAGRSESPLLEAQRRALRTLAAAREARADTRVASA